MLQDQPTLLSTLPPSRGQERLALLAALLLFVAFLITVPFAHIELGRIDVFNPIVGTVMFLNDTITSALLFAQFAVLRSPALLVLATGYFFTGLLMIPCVLTFPGAFSPTGWFGAGLQSSCWLFIAWHIGFPVVGSVYALIKDAEPARQVAPGSVRAAILGSVLGVLGTVVGLTWLVTVHHDALPAPMRNVAETNPIWSYAIAPSIMVVCVIAIALLWARRRSLLDLWLLAVAWAWLLQSILLNMGDSRFSVAWYAHRIFAISAATFVLIVLLWESTVMYARLALSVMAQRREREGRLMTMDAVAASIVHEIKQPLAAIAINAGAGLRWLEREPPDFDKARAALKRITSDTHRASEVIDSIRAIFKQGGQAKAPLVINEVIREAIGSLRDELQARGISVHLELTPGLALVSGHRGQLEQVIVNIATNAAEAMSQIADRPRVLRLRSAASEPDGVLVTVEDSGVGIDPLHSGRIFDAFYTTKSDGTGMGLAICRSIVESHGGRLWVAPGSPHGSVVQFLLPGCNSGDE